MCIFVRVTFLCLHHADISCCGKTDKPNIQCLPVDHLDSVNTILPCMKTSMSNVQKAQQEDALRAKNSALADLEPVTSHEAAKLWGSCWNNWVGMTRSLVEDAEWAWNAYGMMVFRSIDHKLRALEEAKTEA
ncbi:MAG: hypothetical protein M1826_002043 [Phylliscum demangeonii]|nr:MAG: hypothetical protein M1826_002043 [Phylliscum demangeonii]